MDVLNYKEFKVTDDMLASSGSRFANSLIDIFIFYILIAFLAAVFYLVLEFMVTDAIFDWINAIPSGFSTLLTYSVYFLYFMILETLVGKTIGKLITKTSVVLENGEKPTKSAVAIRTISRFVPFDAFTYLGTPSRGWHDRWSKTYVVKDEVLRDHKRLHQQYHELGQENSFLNA